MDSTNRPPAGREALSSPDDVLIVGIGASAGGIEAIQGFFEGLPEDLEGVAFVVIMHLDPERESSLAEVLQHRTSLKVQQLTERHKIEAGSVYVIPPNKSLSVADGHLTVEEFAQPRGQRAPIDLFFRSLANSPGGGIGIAMSGGGSDGAIGLKAVEEAGGLVMVQDPDEAAHDSMPLSVIATGMVDFVLPARELAVKVAEFRRSWGTIQIPGQQTELPKDEQEALQGILGFLWNRTGHDFCDYKDSTVLRRIERRMQVHHVESLGQYLDFLRTHPPEAQALLKSLLISVTQFFRDGDSWDVLAENMIPELLEGDPEENVRIWVPGCATGEEAYSIGILLAERAADLAKAPEFQIFASDLDEEALAFARRGVYPEAIQADVSEERLQRFFSREGHHYRVKEELRERVLFASHNLLKDPPFSRLHLVTCRNLLIYLNRPLQRRVFQIFEYALRPGGYLFLGSAESVDDDTGAFRWADKKHRIYRREETGEPARLPELAFDTPSVDERRIGPARPIEPTGQRGTLPSDELERHEEFLESHAPPSIVVTADHKILHLSESAGRYLERPGGRPSNDVLREVRSELRLDLQAALSEAFDAGRSTSTRPIKVRFNGDASWVHIIVQPGHGDTGDRALVLFAEVAATGVGHAGDTEGPTETERTPLVHRLEEETRRLRDRLQATIEQYESSKEEMKAANEELQSMNEEYKSTAEELETSKEEIQSVNEELTTVNQELKEKVEELAEANSDLQNLMAATEVGTLFLDRDLNIQRYTPHITELFNVMPGDVGRSITHLTHDVEYEHLIEDAELVLDNLVPLEREVRGRRGAWFLMRLRPYRTMRDHIDGVVVTFVDITRRREEEEARRKAEERYRLLVESVEEYAIILLDAEGRISTWNVGAERLFGYDESEALGQPGAIIFTAEDRKMGAPGDELAAAAEHESVTDERWHVRKDGSRFWGSGMMTALHLPDGSLRGFAKGMGDHTDRKRAEDELGELMDSLERRIEERTREVRELASSLTMAEQRERTRIARILHSDLQQMLYSIQMKLTLAREALDDGAAPAVAHLRESDEWLDRALSTTRQLTVELSPPVLEKEGLTDALAWLRTHMMELHDIEVEIVADGPFYLPDEDWRMLLFQAVRELLFNVVKHAGTDRATVELSEREDEILIRVVDEGRGFDVSSVGERSVGDSSVGLLTIGERLKLFGGRMEIESTPGSGTRVSLHAPIEPRRRDAVEAGEPAAEGAS